MNILLLGWRDPKHPLAGGAEQVMHEHAKGWINAGHTVTLFSAHFKGSPRNENIDGINVIRFGYQLLGVHLMAFLWYIFGSHPKFDLVIDQFHGIPFFTPFYVKAKKIAVIQEVAREVWFLNHIPKPFNWIFGMIGYLSEPFYFLFYKKVLFITGSKSARDDLIKFGVTQKNIKIINHGVLVPNSKVNLRRGSQKKIVFLGALAKDKGIEDALIAFSLLTNQNIRLLVIGKGSKEYTNYLFQLCYKLGISKKIKFYGFVSQKQKFKLLSKAHLLVNPSIREGWGLVNIEANARGVPVIAYNSPGLVDSVKNNYSGIICKNNSPKDLAWCIEKVLSDNKKFKKMQYQALLWSKRFSWQKSIKESLNLLEHLY